MNTAERIGRIGTERIGTGRIGRIERIGRIGTERIGREGRKKVQLLQSDMAAGKEPFESVLEETESRNVRKLCFPRFEFIWASDTQAEINFKLVSAIFNKNLIKSL